MKINILFENKEDYLYSEVSGDFDATEIMSYIQIVKNKCDEENARKVLISFMGLNGTIDQEIDRYYLGEAIAQIIGYKIKIALVWYERNINKFAETVAVNRGADFRVFSDFGTAKKWLMV